MNHSELRQLAELVASVDAALVPATHGRGVDGNGARLPNLDANVHQALHRLVLAGDLAQLLLANLNPQSIKPCTTSLD